MDLQIDQRENEGVQILDLIVLTGLDGSFDVFMNEQDAVNSFFPERAVRHFDILEFVKENEKPSSREPPK